MATSIDDRINRPGETGLPSRMEGVIESLDSFTSTLVLQSGIHLTLNRSIDQRLLVPGTRVRLLFDNMNTVVDVKIIQTAESSPLDEQDEKSAD